VNRTGLLIALLVFSCGITSPIEVAAKGNGMAVTSQTREAAFRRTAQIWEGGRIDLIGEIVTQDYVGHTSAGDRNIDGLRRRISEVHALYPDMKFTIEDQFAQSDRIATRMTAVGTSKATGKVVHLIGLNISRFVGNRIAEEWPVWEVVQTKW
jgi:predicted ester cyclase